MASCHTIITTFFLEFSIYLEYIIALSSIHYIYTNPYYDDNIASHAKCNKIKYEKKIERKMLFKN